jgi:lipopolysaccharide export system permease protein
MSILFRYLAKEIAVSTAFLLLALLALFALFDLIRELGQIGRGNYGLLNILAYVSLSQPSHVVVIFPVAALLGTLFAVSRLSAQSELTVMRSSGLSLGRLAGLAAIIGVLFSAIIFAFGEFVAPVSEEAAKKLRLSATSNVVARQFRSGFWVKDDRSFVNIQNVTPETELISMRIFEFDDQFRLVSIKLAERGRYVERNLWQLENVEVTTFETVGKSGKTKGSAQIVRLTKSEWRSAMTPDLLSVLRVKPEEMSIANLSAFIDHLRENKQSTTRYEMALWNKIFQPVGVIVMMLLAIPFAIQSNRAGGVGAKLVLGTMIGIGAYFFNQLVGHLTVLNDWPPMLSASLPLAVFLAVALALLLLKEYPRRPSFAG